MTLPDERARAISNTREFLYNLMDPKKTPRVPKEVRRRARSCLKHFPSNLDIELVTEGKTDVFEKPKEWDDPRPFNSKSWNSR
jgi:hypothetical protein